jgi:pyruvate formate lyase activating enzyme
MTAYGRSGGFCIDPIEKKPLYHFLPGTPTLSFGTIGCNLGCRFCQNWSASKARKEEMLFAVSSPEAIVKASLHHGCRSVAFTYNDPVTTMEYAIDVSQACHDAGIKTVAVSAGYMCEESRAEFYAHMDAANIDLKAFTETFYWNNTKSHLKPVLDTLEYLRRNTNVWFEISNLVIPGENDSAGEIHQMTQWIAENLGPDVPLHFSAFHPAYKMLDRPPTPFSTLARARHIAIKNGLRHVYVGNLRDPSRQATYCHQCGSVLIKRSGQRITEWRLTPHGRCPSCGTGCVGIFEEDPGDWGSRREPIDINDFYN